MADGRWCGGAVGWWGEGQNVEANPQQPQTHYLVIFSFKIFSFILHKPQRKMRASFFLIGIIFSQNFFGIV